MQHKLYLGNLDSSRDWGYAGDYVEAMWSMLQQAAPDDYVVATGESHTVREFLDEAAAAVDIDWHTVVELDPRYLRPTEVDMLLGDATKARTRLGWEPRITFRGLVQLMMKCDLDLARQEKTLREAGFTLPMSSMHA